MTTQIRQVSPCWQHMYLSEIHNFHLVEERFQLRSKMPFKISTLYGTHNEQKNNPKFQKWICCYQSKARVVILCFGPRYQKQDTFPFLMRIWGWIFCSPGFELSHSPTGSQIRRKAIRNASSLIRVGERAFPRKLSLSKNL